MNYTTIEQSKHLLELGLCPDSADMIYYEHKFTGALTALNGKAECTEYKNCTGDIHVIPCWSVGALLEIIWKSLPSVMIIPGSRFDIEPQYWCTTDNEEICYDTDYYASAIEALYDMICWLLQNNYIKTE